ncbi:MAG: orotidine-5'-phosphate decarboxylase [Gammaproteobacteria bacterium]|nr:orotidine-5'-phosphate decarboxylase [Gammaproteobacteria bacterium]
MNNSAKIIVALDYADQHAALALVKRLIPGRCKLKVGKELFTRAGPALVTTLVDKGFDVFLDLKFHDIPTTVARACEAAARLGVWMLNVHALGGRAMLVAAREAIDKTSHPPLLIAVTVLTSLSDADLAGLGFQMNIAQTTQHLAKLALHCGLNGVVCSAQEAHQLRQLTSPQFTLVTPGIRLPDAAGDDQKRIATPFAALSNGANYLVIGRPITQAPDPMVVIEAIEHDITLVNM